jgi:hypothetical protein
MNEIRDNPPFLTAIIWSLILIGLNALPGAFAPPAHAQDTGQFDQPFDRPQFLIHATGHGTTSGPVTDDQYILYIEEPDASGVFREADGFGGTISYSSDFHTGPLTTPRSVCDAAAAQGLPAQEWTPYNRTNTFDCRLLTGQPAPAPTEQPAPAPAEQPGPAGQLAPPEPSIGVQSPVPARAPESHVLRTIVIEIVEGIAITVILGGVIGAGAKAYRVWRAARIAREVEEATEAIQAVRAARGAFSVSGGIADEEYIRRLLAKGVEQLTEAERAYLRSKGYLL